jgi:ureidoglycolate lyase
MSGPVSGRVVGGGVVGARRPRRSVRLVPVAPSVIVPVPVSPEVFAPFGHVIAQGADAPAGTLDLAGGTPRLWVMSVTDRPPVFDRITRHHRVTQALASADAIPFWLVVAAPGTDPAAVGAALRAFIVPPATAVLLHAGTWHAGPFFAPRTMRFFNLELADTNDVDHDTVHLDGPVRIEIDAPVPPLTRTVLVVANRTATSPQLLAALGRLVAAGTTSFRVVVPAANPGAGLRALVAANDPMTGVPVMSAMELPVTEEAARREAEARLAGLIAELRTLGAEADGEVGPNDPLDAVARALAVRPADEILLSTLPAGLSRWLSRDLPSRCARRFGLPVTHVEAEA